MRSRFLLRCRVAMPRAHDIAPTLHPQRASARSDSVMLWRDMDMYVLPSGAPRCDRLPLIKRMPARDLRQRRRLLKIPPARGVFARSRRYDDVLAAQVRARVPAEPRA